MEENQQVKVVNKDERTWAMLCLDIVTSSSRSAAFNKMLVGDLLPAQGRQPAFP